MSSGSSACRTQTSTASNNEIVSASTTDTLSTKGVSGSGAVRRIDANDEFANCTVVLHVGVRLADVVEAVDVRRAEGNVSRSDLVEVGLKNVSRQVGALATVGRKPHALGQVGDRVEVRHDPL